MAVNVSPKSAGLSLKLKVMEGDTEKTVSKSISGTRADADADKLYAVASALVPLFNGTFSHVERSVVSILENNV